ncbi:MAG: DnaD domain protein [Lachnospiraceae bacterium]|nr:DnaD domain protein [Lachnospiraceae bacterium]
MCTIRMKSKTKQFGTAVPNLFIDRFMNSLDGSFIRVYLYLLRHYTGSNPNRRDSAELSVSTMADRLCCMESDIHRALRELQNKGLLDVSFDEKKRVTGIELVDLFEYEEDAAPIVPEQSDAYSSAESAPVTEATVAPAESKPDYSVMEKAFSVTSEIQDRFAKDPAYEGLTDLLEQLLNAPMSPDLYRLMLFTYDGLHFPMDLIVFLFSYCIELGKTSPKYISKVAVTWAENGISSDKEAEQFVLGYDSAVRVVRAQFGLRKDLGKVQLEFIQRWSRSWSMPVELIEEACRRTVLNTNEASFSYAEKILSDWHEAGFTTLAEVQEADSNRPQKAPRGKRGTAGDTHAAANAFNSGYQQREYTAEEYSALELAMRKRH